MKCTLACVMFLTCLAESGIPWPVGVSPDGQDSTWTIMNSYGNFHVGWDSLSKYHCNFHFGIDIPDFTDIIGPDTVRCVRDGTVTCIIQSPIPGSTQYQWALVICDSQSSSDGWSYHHMDSLLPYCQQLGDTLDKSWSISCMNSDLSIPHLHFMRSSYQYNPYNPGDGLLNPIDSLIPAASLCDGFTWEFNSAQDTLFFLSDMDYTDWPEYSVGCQDSVWKYQVTSNSLYGKVDLFYGYRLLGIGVNDNPFNLYPLCPQRIMWTLTSSASYTAVFNRYVADFSGAIGEAADSTKYKQFYFRWSYLHWLVPNLGNGLISCLSNCSDDTSGYSGIDSIQENSWATNLHSSGSGAAQLPEEAMYPDGAYQIEVKSFAWDSTEHEVTTDVIVDNFVPSIEEIVVYTISLSETGLKRKIYREYWLETTPDSRIRTCNPIDYLSEYPSRLGVAVRYSENMDLDNLGYFWFTGERANEVVFSTEGDRSRRLFPVEGLPQNLGIDFSVDYEGFWQCYETSADCSMNEIGYIGHLAFHTGDSTIINRAFDLAGNEMDYDPSSISDPRDPETGQFDSTQIESYPYDTESWGDALTWDWNPSAHIANGYLDGSVVATVYLDSIGFANKFEHFCGDCFHYCGFWLRWSEGGQFNEYWPIVDFLGNYITLVIQTEFPVATSGLSQYWQALSCNPPMASPDTRYMWRAGRTVDWINEISKAYIYCLDSHTGYVGDSLLCTGIVWDDKSEEVLVDSDHLCLAHCEQANLDLMTCASYSEILSVDSLGVAEVAFGWYTAAYPSALHQDTVLIAPIVMDTRQDFQIERSRNGNHAENRFRYSIRSNPAYEELTIDFTGTLGNTYTLDLFDISGRIVLSEMRTLDENTHSSCILDVGWIPSGVYLLNIRSGEVSETRTISIIH